MSVELKQNLSAILKALEERGMKTTNIAKSMGYTTTSQLHSIVDGDSLVSTRAIINMIENLSVSPTYLFLGKGAMFLTDEDEIEELRKKVHELEHNHSEAVKTVYSLYGIIQKLEKRNADLIDLTSAAIKYHKGQQEDKTDNETSNQLADISKDIFNKKLQDTFKSITPAVIEPITIGDVEKFLEEEAKKEEEKEKAKEKKLPSSLIESKK
jgi:predicted transcriptional regulator